MDGDEESFCVPKGAKIEKIGSYEGIRMAYKSKGNRQAIQARNSFFIGKISPKSKIKS
jgi:hypothetical protein